MVQRRSRVATPRLVASTNRGETKVRSTNPTPSRLYQPDDYGIDKLRLAFPIRDPLFKSSKWVLNTHDGPSGAVAHSGHLEVSRRSHDFQINVYRSYGSWMCSFEFNPARIVDPDGYGLCHPEDLADVIDEVTETVRSHVAPILPNDCFTVRRLDIARNFQGVDQPARYLLGLRPVARPYATRESLWFDKGVPATLWAGLKSGDTVKLYDKHLQAPQLTPSGTVRVEVQALQGWCKRYGGIERVEDLTPENIDILFDNRTDWMGLKREVMTVESAIDKILQIEGMDVRTKLGLLEYASAVRRGTDPLLTVKASALTKYKQILKDLGIAPYLDVDFDRATFRLDFESGTEVRVA
jgi:hypothetical protein